MPSPEQGDLSKAPEYLRSAIIPGGEKLLNKNFRITGEFRIPKKGDIILSQHGFHAVIAECDFMVTEYYILKETSK